MESINPKRIKKAVKPEAINRVDVSDSDRLVCGDCLVEMAKLKDDSIDLLFCDLPYGETNCHWDCMIDLSQFWEQVNRVCKDTTPMFFTCSTKFGVTLINSNPKNFRYDMVWVKSAPCGFLNAMRMPMKKHEMVYVFYRKLPFYDLSSHERKFVKEVARRGGVCYGSDKPKSNQYSYKPTLPVSVLGEEDLTAIYDPSLPNTILNVKSEKGIHSTQKPTALIEWCLKYYSKEGDTVLDPTMGSGSTGVACKKMNRKFIGIEKDEAIFEAAKKRIHMTPVIP